MFIYHNDRLSVKCDRCECVVFDYPTAGFVEAFKGKEFVCVTCLSKTIELTEEKELSRLEIVRQKNAKHYQLNKEYVKFKTKMRRIKMKKTSGLLLILFVLSFFACDAYPQNVEVKVEYTLQAGIDSAKIVLWKGVDPAQCQLEEDGDWETLDKTGLHIIDVGTGSSSYTFTLVSNGETIKVAAVQKSGVWWSNLATSSFIVLPMKPGKVGIISVQIIIP